MSLSTSLEVRKLFSLEMHCEEIFQEASKIFGNQFLVLPELRSPTMQLFKISEGRSYTSTDAKSLQDQLYEVGVEVPVKCINK